MDRVFGGKSGGDFLLGGFRGERGGDGEGLVEKVTGNED